MKPFVFYRERLAWVLLAIFFVLPWIKWGENPFLMFNFFEKKFFFLFKEVYPQEFFLFAMMMVAFFISFLVLTYRYGRVFCGWVCPQTIFLEFVFKKIDSTLKKYLKHEMYFSSIKYMIYIIISLLFSFTILIYIIGSQYVIELPTSDFKIKYLIFLGVVTAIFFVVFTVIREKSCTLVCPYGRVQGILADNKTYNVTYDVNRGEPRGKFSRTQTVDLGDCVDCKLCVKVCPTHIDIRNGYQLECINCKLCIDACDLVMNNLKRPANLISYNSIHNIENHQQNSIKKSDYFLWAASLIPLIFGISFFLFSSDYEIVVKRVPGTTYQILQNGNYTNLYNVQIINKTQNELEISMSSKDIPHSKIKIVGEKFSAKPQMVNEAVFFLEIPKSEIEKPKQEVEIDFWNGSQKLKNVKTMFLSPFNNFIK